MRDDKKLIAEALLEMAFERSRTTIIESADKELIKAAIKIGIVIPSPDLAVFKTVYAEIDKPNKNNVILPKKEALEGLPSLIGKQVNFEHKGAGYICGYIIDAKIVSDKIEIIFVMFKSLFMEQMEKIKAGFKKKEIAVSFEIWNIQPDTGESVIHPVGHKYVEIKPILYHGVGLLIESKPACPSAIVYKMIANILDESKKVAGKIFGKNLIYASLALVDEIEESSYQCECLNCGKVITTNQHCKDIKCPSCGGDMRRKDRPGKGQPVSKSIIIKTEKIDKIEWICPYCEKTIGEKELFYDDKTNKWYHRPCQEKGEIILPEENIKKEENQVELENIYANVKKEEDISFDIAMAYYYSSDEERGKLTEDAVKWTRKFINDLPDSAFAVIEPAYPEKTDNKNARHLPHHNGDGDLGKEKSNKNIDKSHLKNAMARANQIKPITDSISAEDLQKKAMTHLNRHKDVFEKSEETKTEEPKAETKIEETPKIEAEIETDETKVKETKAEEKIEGEQKVEETKADGKKVEETKTEEKAEEKSSDKVEEKKDDKTEAEVVQQENPEQQKKLVKSTTEINETIVNTYTDDKGSGDTIYNFHSKTTKEFADGTTDVIENDSNKKTRYSFAELEEAVQKAKDEVKKEYEDKIKAKDDEIKIFKEDNDKKIKEKDTEIENIKAELDKKNQEVKKIEAKDKATNDLTVGSVEVKNRYESIRDEVNRKAFGTKK